MLIILSVKQQLLLINSRSRQRRFGLSQSFLALLAFVFIVATERASCQEETTLANLRLTQLNGNPIDSLPKSAVFISGSLLANTNGTPIYAISNGSMNNSNSWGCDKYSNTLGKSKFISIVYLNYNCSVDSQISVASSSGANALIIVDYFNSFSPIKTSKNQTVTILIGNNTNQILKNYMNEYGTDLVLFISFADTFKESFAQSRELTTGSIVLIVIGSVFVILIVISMWVIFCLIQRTRRLDDRQRAAITLKKLTRKALTKTECLKLQDHHTEIVEKEVCVICLESYKLNDTIRKLPCSHYFHKSEIDTWLNGTRTCPICKENIIKAYGLNNEYNKSNLIRRTLERFSIIPEPVNLNDLLNEPNESRRATAYSRRETIYSVGTVGTSMISESYYNGIRRNTFFGEYPIEVSNYTQMQDESEQNETTTTDENAKQKLELLEEEKPDPNQT